MNPRPNNMGASVFEHVRREAKERKRDVQAEAQSYAIRRFIARLMGADQEGRASIKGGQALGILFGNDRRPTKDLDLSINGSGLDDPDGWVRRLIEAACADIDDGVSFKSEDIQIEHRVHQGSGGYRMTIRSTIHTCRTDFVVDVGMTDSLKFKPIDVTLDDRYPHAPASPVVRVYPVEASFAEKLLSKIEDGASNIRHKDFYDLWNIHKITTKIGDLGYITASTFDLSDETLAWRDEVVTKIKDGTFLELPDVDVAEECLDMFGYALYRCSLTRGTPIPADIMTHLREEFANDQHQSTQYSNWIKNQRARLINLPPGSDDKGAALGILLDEIDAFVSVISTRAGELMATYGNEPPSLEILTGNIMP
ncbi:nucleotidyl transferase AbiEii/AbiGii toxin family protein [Agrobacterium rubi]|nr:nucleotidyl transferase AbiEii/AbiGii toxin family protein [Agrobacterium rubi]NTF24044.1 nucleotidyl transferase AbiEii/AbiGii toxin family protein [Agrobacterium rubi]